MEVQTLMEKIDNISNLILKNDEKAYDDLLDLTDDIGTALEGCAAHIEEINSTGCCVSENDIMNIVEIYGAALRQKDNMLMTDILCFEIYPILNSYKTILQG